MYEWEQQIQSIVDEIDRCISCGTCSYVCPAKLDIADNIKAAKAARRKNTTGGLGDAR